MAEQPRRRVVVVHTGGTIFMQKTERGRDTVEIERPIDQDKAISSDTDFEIIDLFGKGGVDSSRLTLRQSRILAEKIAQLQNDKTVDGIVVTHGTDTMAETGMELAYSLKNLHKPVVLTGAQIPVSEPSSDGLRNFFRSVYLAGHASDLRKVVICFGYERRTKPYFMTNQAWNELLKTHEGGALLKNPPNLVIDAINSAKAHVARQDAFRHPDARVLGTITVAGGAKIDFKTAKPSKATTVDFGFSPNVNTVSVRQYKGKLPILGSVGKGLVVEVYGTGNAPDAVIAQMRRRAKFFPVVAASQAHGNVDMTAYAAGEPALQAGVLPSGGHTPLSASIRLAYLLAHKREIRKAASFVGVKPRKVLETLYLSGGKFDSAEIKERHSVILGVPINNTDLMTQGAFIKAAVSAAKQLKKFTDERHKKKD